MERTLNSTGPPLKITIFAFLEVLAGECSYSWYPWPKTGPLLSGMVILFGHACSFERDTHGAMRGEGDSRLTSQISWINPGDKRGDRCRNWIALTSKIISIFTLLWQDSFSHKLMVLAEEIKCVDLPERARMGLTWDMTGSRDSNLSSDLSLFLGKVPKVIFNLLHTAPLKQLKQKDKSLSHCVHT